MSSANRAHENYLCQGGTKERQTKQLDMAERIVYHQGTPILSASLLRLMFSEGKIS